MRARNIDFLKGLLIVLVISGHILQASPGITFIRYLIYSFHMPLFIGIAGYLFNYAKSSNVSLKQLFKKYFFRVIVPWSIAVVTYTLLFDRQQFTLQQHGIGFFRVFAFPYYHLWFIPAFLSWIGLSWIFAKLKIPVVAVLLIGGIISLASFMLHIYPGLFPSLQQWQPVNFVQFTLRPWFYIFFAFGMYLQLHPLTKYRGVLSGMLYIFIPVTVLLFFFPIKITTIVAFFLLNIGLVYWAIHKAGTDSLPHSKAIEWLGINSLAVYLWHILPVSLIIGITGTANHTLFYTLTFSVETVFILLLYQLTKIGFINRYFFGMK